MKHVVSFSGGVGSWAAAKRVAERFGTADLTLLFADTLIEDEDLYRFLDDAAANIGVPVTRIAEGRTPWQVFHDERFLGNSRLAECSRILKGEFLDAWRATHLDPADTINYVGIDWTERHRLARLQIRRAPWRYEAPMCDPPYLTKVMMLDWLKAEGIKPPRLYALGFSHNNCGGFCVKAGIGHFTRLLATMPERYADHENKEEEMRQYLGRDDIAILKDRTGGQTKSMTLRVLRERVEAGAQIDMFDAGGCGCAID